MSAAELELVCSAPLHELQLLLLSLAVKAHFHEQQRAGSSGSKRGCSSSSASVRRQQQRQQNLSAAQHPHLLAMLQACGLSSQQAAAAAAAWPPADTAVACLTDQVVFSKLNATSARCADYARDIVDRYVRQQEQQLQQREQQQQQQQLQQPPQQLVEQQQQIEQQETHESCSTQALIRTFFTMSYPAALMLLEAGVHSFQSE
jgi:hypothetical protein